MFVFEVRLIHVAIRSSNDLLASTILITAPLISGAKRSPEMALNTSNLNQDASPLSFQSAFGWCFPSMSEAFTRRPPLSCQVAACLWLRLSASALASARRPNHFAFSLAQGVLHIARRQSPGRASWAGLLVKTPVSQSEQVLSNLPLRCEFVDRLRQEFGKLSGKFVA